MKIYYTTEYKTSFETITEDADALIEHTIPLGEELIIYVKEKCLVDESEETGRKIEDRFFDVTVECYDKIVESFHTVCYEQAMEIAEKYIEDLAEYVMPDTYVEIVEKRH